jgi:hypothetical protein
VQWVKHMEDEGYINRTFLISPTAETNSIFKNLRTLDDDICTENSKFQSALKEVLDQVKEANTKYEESLVYKALYKKYVRGEELEPSEDAMLASRNYTQPIPVQKPRCLLICDDVQGTDLFTNNRTDLMVHLVIKHRHIPISIIMMAQSFKGIPHAIRLNCTVYIIFATSDLKQLQMIYEHFGSMVSKEKFMQMYQYATSTPHGFLMIDSDPKTPEQRFRSGFNELLTYK